jgi:hypothetical protein
MADEIRQRIDAFNELLAQFGFPYRVDIVDPHDLKAAAKNARFMSGQMFQQLVENIKRDGGLTSAPFCWRDAQGVTHIMSGHHRVDAAIKAGEEFILILYTDRELSKQEQIAIQLSHNSISGEDEPTTLRELWNEILAIDLKAYSGLDDQVLKSFEPVKIDSLGEQNPAFQEITLAFFPSEIERVNDVLTRLAARRRAYYVAQIEQFDRFVDRLMDFKEAAGIYNSATAILAILDIVEEWLAQQADAGEIEESNGEAQQS